MNNNRLVAPAPSPPPDHCSSQTGLSKQVLNGPDLLKRNLSATSLASASLSCSDSQDSLSPCDRSDDGSSIGDAASLAAAAASDHGGLRPGRYSLRCERTDSRGDGTDRDLAASPAISDSFTARSDSIVSRRCSGGGGGGGDSCGDGESSDRGDGGDSDDSGDRGDGGGSSSGGTLPWLSNVQSPPGSSSELKQPSSKGVAEVRAPSLLLPTLAKSQSRKKKIGAPTKNAVVVSCKFRNQPVTTCPRPPASGSTGSLPRPGARGRKLLDAGHKLIAETAERAKKMRPEQDALFFNYSRLLRTRKVPEFAQSSPQPRRKGRKSKFRKAGQKLIAGKEEVLMLGTYAKLLHTHMGGGYW